MHGRTHARQRKIIGVFLYAFSYYLETGSLPEQEAYISARLAGQETPRIHPSLCPTVLGYRYRQPHLAFMYRGAVGPNSGSPACPAGVLPTEPPVQPVK